MDIDFTLKKASALKDHNQESIKAEILSLLKNLNFHSTFLYLYRNKLLFRNSLLLSYQYLRNSMHQFKVLRRH
jgi:hypothetical protein